MILSDTGMTPCLLELYAIQNQDIPIGEFDGYSQDLIPSTASVQ